MRGRIASLYRHPVKGFTPERLLRADLTEGACFPHDRMFAVENGPSGFDPSAPQHRSKTRFTVLAQIPAIARIRTAYDEATGLFTAEAPGQAPIAADLDRPADREAFAAWLTEVLDDDVIRGPLKVVSGPPHRFMDDPRGHVSLINLASVRDLADRAAFALDPLRFRANLYVEDLPAWAELAAVGARVAIGGATAEVVKPITRCVATHVDPSTGERDFELVHELRRHYGHLFCGVYLRVLEGGPVAEGDAVSLEVAA